MPFFQCLRVQFEHTDAQGRVFYAHYFSFVEQARYAFWEHVGLSEDEVRQIEQDAVIVHLEADYLGPAGFYDLLRVYVAVEELGRSSIRLGYRIVQERTGEEIFRARMVMVQIDLATGKAQPWRPAFRHAIIQHHGPQVARA